MSGQQEESFFSQEIEPVALLLPQLLLQELVDLGEKALHQNAVLEHVGTIPTSMSASIAVAVMEGGSGKGVAAVVVRGDGGGPCIFFPFYCRMVKEGAIGEEVEATSNVVLFLGLFLLQK